MRILVTGSTGQIGSELIPELSRKYGRESIVATSHKKPPGEKLSSFALFESLDVTDKNTVSIMVKKHGIDVVYHLAGILSAAGEKNPELAWQTNMSGLHNVLEVAREQEIARVFWPSSIAVFGPNSPRVSTPQETALIPRTIYGITKVAGELLCNYYFTRFGLDVRSIRYPGIISSETLPGGGTTDYAVEIFYKAIKEKRYSCFVRKDTVLPMLYMPDCIEATLNLMDADPAKIRFRTSYNLGGLTFSAEDLANEIKEYIPDFVVDYSPDFRQEIADSWPMSIDDSAARIDWGWKPTYDLASMTRDMIEKLSKRL
ncbi:MAG TPA: NAD-dependent epimerase/dehydratase family protein [Nitrososphaerales archaeon]|nr:NAD-dependent epimerase/dehydratase family protein [Nitrososphaerales archaeon]